MKYLRQIALILTFLFGVIASGYADDIILVDDTWADGNRTSSGPDGSGIDSAWYTTTDTSLGVIPGHMYATNGASSLTFLTYFAPDSAPVTLSGAGDTLKITWTFTPLMVNSSNTSQAFNFAVADTPTAVILSTDNFSITNGQYWGYAMFCNMGGQFNNSTPYGLRKWAGNSADFLVHSGNWTALANGATRYNHGYDSGTSYTMVWTITRGAAGEEIITNTMTGGNLNSQGYAKVTYTNTSVGTSPTNYTYDTFCVRPSNSNNTAVVFDNTHFKVEFISGAAPAAIQTEPQDQTVYETQNATFNVVASGTAPLSYQWYYTNNIDTSRLLSGGTNSSLTLTSVQLTNAGGYWVVVTNVYGSATSSVAQLTVNIPVVPSITVQPQDQPNILPGAPATFSVVATGTDPLTYQWYYNTSTLLTNATDLSLTITNIQPGNAGSYSVAVSNFAGGVISSNAVLTVNTSPTAPVFFLQPASLVVVTGSMVSFSALAAGTQPIGYQWSKNSTPIPGATSATLNLTNVQTADDGTYTVIASNSVGSTTSGPGQLTVTIAMPPIYSAYNLTGFGQATTGGGVIPETDPAYRKVTNALDLANAILSAYKTNGSVKVIEITTNLDLGFDEIDPAVRTLPSTPFRRATTPLLHPRLLVTGVSIIDIRPLSGLTIFSANGAAIRHATFNFKTTGNIIVRNLKFDELWEWDESTTGAYDRNGWDFIDLNSGGVSNIWIDHCTFTKAYDGIIDTQAGATNITISWCKFAGDDGATNSNSWVWQQINSLEANKTLYAMYYAIRTAGCSTTDIVTIIQGHDKTSIAGGGTDTKNLTISMTYHHDWFNNCWDRVVPRLRGGNVHDYNIYVDDTLLLAAKNLRGQFVIPGTYSFNPPMNGAISTEGGALLVEKSVYIDCMYPLRNNQTDPSDAFYTGKIMALDTIYQMNSTIVRGNSTNSGNPMGPFQALVIPFSWNLAGNQLPYTYTTDDPAQLQAIVTSPTGGASSGVLNWDKTNWLMTAYGATAPTIVADPQSQSYTAGQSATFTVAAGGSAPLSYQWYYNTNTPIPNATNTSLTLANLQTTNAGTYSAIVTNLAGSATSSYAPLTVTAANTAPTLTPVPDTNIIAGVALNITNVVTDSDLPPQTLTFSLLSAPGSANLDATSGVFSWRPLISQAGTTNLITEKVADNGTPILSATQSFHVIVSAPVNPQTPAVAFSNGQFGLTINGDIGPDYIVLASTNLTDWAGIFTNPSPALPFSWSDPGTSNFDHRFYRIELGP